MFQQCMKTVEKIQGLSSNQAELEPQFCPLARSGVVMWMKITEQTHLVVEIPCDSVSKVLCLG